MRLKVPDDVGFASIAHFTAELSSNFDRCLEFDFSDVNFTGPAWLAIMGGAFRRLREINSGVKRRVINHKHLAYAAHMGFFRYFGVEHGLQPAAAAGSETYVPISERDTTEVLARAASLMCSPGEVVQTDAVRLATVLTQQSEGKLHETLAYSIREIVRNVVEHSGAPSYTLAAQWWPGLGQVELVVTDRGCGLAASLRENPRLSVNDDEDALRKAILPGVSSKASRNQRPYDDWANSGYGLFMTQRLSALGGTFGLMSGGRAIVVKDGNVSILEANWPGVAVALRLDTRELAALSRRLADFRREGAHLERAITGAARIGASGASQTAKPKITALEPE